MVLVYVHRNFNRVLATDTQTNKSKEIVVAIMVCNCSGHGNCTQDSNDILPGSETFTVARCICENEYEGIIVYIVQYLDGVPFAI